MELTFNKKKEEYKMDLTVEKSKRGDKEAFSMLIQDNKLVMFKVAKRILENDEDIKDVIQETIIKAYNGITNLRRNQYFRTWLIRILINECNRVLKDKKVDDKIAKPLKPQKLDFGKLGSIEIKKIVKENNEIRLTVKKEGLAPLNEYFWLKGNKQKDTLSCSNLKQISTENKDEVIMIFTNNNIVENYNIDEVKNYSINYNQPYKLNIYKDKAVKIDLSK